MTVNDAVLAMCAGALRYYLIERNALPDRPLIAMVPVSLRSKEDADAGGNLVGSVLCNLATHVDDPAQRIQTISASMDGNKKVLSELPQLQVACIVGIEYGAADVGGCTGFLVGSAATVQHRHLECAGAGRPALLRHGPA